MKDVRRVPDNGLRVVSTFSGCGGSSLGYRMAGCRVLWANEFIPAAQDSYRANFPKTILDTRDIRTVKPEEILEAVGMKKGELDIFDGSPPCDPFSTAGPRDKKWGKVKAYSGTAQRTDDLSLEYLRILKGLMPRAFVMENVKGMVLGRAVGFFIDLLKALQDAGYNAKARVLDAQWLGVPQSRQRLIIVGIRKDLGVEPMHPTPLPYRYSVMEAIGQQVIHDTSGLFSQGDVSCRPAPAITSGVKGLNAAHYKVKSNPPRVRSSTRGGGWKGWESRGLQRPAPTFTGQSAIGFRYKTGFNAGNRRSGKPAAPAIMAHGFGGSGHSQYEMQDGNGFRKLTIDEAKALCSFPPDFVLKGTYAQQWERLGNCVPPLMMKAVAEKVRDALLSVSA